MTAEYVVQGPSCSGILPAIPNLIPKWSHSVVAESDFCSEWVASHRATELALQFGYSTFSMPSVHSSQCRKPVGSASVSFCPEVEVYLGTADSIQMHRIVVPAEVLDTNAKPWSDRFVPAGRDRSNARYNFAVDLACPDDHLFAAFFPADDMPTYDDCSRDTDVCNGSEGAPQRSFGAAENVVSTQGANHCEPGLVIASIDGTSGDACVVHPSSVITPQIGQEACCDPLSTVAVLIPGPNHCDAASIPLFDAAFRGRSVFIAGHHQSALESVAPFLETAGVVLAPQSSRPSDALPGPSNAPSGSSERTDPPGLPQVPVVPQFALGMLAALPVSYQTNLVKIVQGILVRSWLIHHVRFPRSLQPRQCVLRGPPHTWRAQLIAIWLGLLDPHEEPSIDLIKPGPPRNWHEHSIVFDVVLAQGLEAGRLSGLVTVAPTFQHVALTMYAVAVSFAPALSGQDIVTDADIQDVCNLYSCLLFHDGRHLPIDFDRQFQMFPGAGFVAFVSHRPSEDVAAHAAFTDPVSESSPVHGDDMDTDNIPSVAADSGSDGTEVVPDASPEHRSRATFYRLDCLPLSAWVRTTSFDALFSDVLALTHIEPEDLVEIHRTRAKPVGETFHETSFIIQRRGDMPAESPDQLILLDVVFHQHGPAVSPAATPAFDRRVLRVPPDVTRAGLLTLARVANYCASSNACVVVINHEVWTAQHVYLRRLPHGSYARIHVPPPQATGMETCRVVSYLEALCDVAPPTFEQVYPTLPSHARSNVRTILHEDRPLPNVLSDGLPFMMGSIRQHHASQEQQVEPQPFDVPVPEQAAPIFPNVPDWSTFELGLRQLFEEFSHTDLPEEGPVLHVVTWFIHHEHTPVCIVGRLVRLSQNPWEWLQLLCTPWLPLIRPFQNLAIHVVRPNPTPDVPGQQIVHVILEQGLQIARKTALLSVLFHGIHGDVTHRRAQSIPTHLSREVIERVLGIDEICRQRKCTAWSGRLQFHRNRLDQVAQAIGISVTVAPFRHRFAQVDDDGYPVSHVASSSSSSIPPRMSFRHDDATLFPQAADVASDVGVLPEHAPSRLIPQLRVIWEQYLMSNPVRPFRFYVETWFCDHDRFPRTDRSREVQLPPDQESWRAALEDKWRDMIDPTVELFIYVVEPPPLGGASDVLAHVILAQHQHRGFISALITTLAPGDDPWDPPRVASKLPTVIDKALLIQESGLFLFCPPFMPSGQCRAHYGDVEIKQDRLHDAQSGDGYLCTADAAPAAPCLIPHDLGHANHIQHLFGSLAQIITKLVHATLPGSTSQVFWDDQVAGLDLELQHTQQYIETFCCAQRLVGSAPAPLSVEPLNVQCCSSHRRVDPIGGRAPDTGCDYVLDAQQLESIHSLWHEHVCSRGDSHVPLAIQVWFSDHFQCPDPGRAPVVELSDRRDHWSREILSPWRHLVNASSEIEMHLVQSKDLDWGFAADVGVILVQNPVRFVHTVVFALFPDGDLRSTPHLQLALVADPICPATLDFSVRHYCGFHFADSTWTFDFLWGTQILPPGGLEGCGHGVCIGVLPRLSPEPWVGLSDQDFGKVLAQQFPAPPLVQVPKPVVSAPVTISLQATLPIRPIDPASVECDDTLPMIAIAEQADWKQLLFDQELPCLAPLPEGFVIPPATYWALVDDTPLNPSVQSWAEIYVDGSANSVSSAWSVVVVRTDGVAKHFVGSLYGKVSVCPQCTEWIGATTTDNISAELSAFAVALDLACRMVPVQAVIRPDLQLSAMLAAHQCVTTSNPKLAQLIMVLASWMPSDAIVREVRGHTRHPWNDLADALARWSLTHEPVIPHCTPVLNQLVSSAADLDWAWIQGGPRSLYQSLPPVIDQQVCQFPLSLRKAPPSVPASSLGEGPSQCSLSVFSLNVLALDTVNHQLTHGRQRGQRTARLDILWHQEKAHIIGLQEARTEAGRHVTDHYLIFASGYEDPRAPRFGCEIWLHRSLPLIVLDDGTPVCAPAFKFVIVHADPRRLILRADHAGCSFMVTVLHAPCLAKTKGFGHRPIDDIDNWWQETSRILETCSPTMYHWLCVDANAPLASQETDCFALAHAEPSNPQGALFEDFLLRHQFAVPSTFSDIQQGAAWTWTHSSGSRCRRDYVLVPLAQLSCVHRASTLPSYDGTFCHEDHIPTGIQFAALLPSATGKSKPKWDELAFLDPNRVAQFQAALRTLPLPTWDVNTTDHCALYESQLLQLGQQFFGGKPKTRTRPQLKQATLALIAFKRHLLDVGRAWDLMTDEVFKLELRAVEKVVRKAVYEDLACFYDQLLVRLQNADSAADAKQMYRILDRLGRKRASGGGPRPLPMLKAPDGTSVPTFQQQQQVWLHQFAAIEAGVPMTWSALYALCRPGIARKDFELDPNAFVTPWQLLQAMRKLRRGKACGPNSIPPDLLKAGGATFAMQLSCLTNKVIAHAHEPTTWRGGKLVPLYKGKGSPHDPASFRSIFISDFTAKLYHACLRRPLEHVWHSNLHSIQFGGRAGCGVDLPHHFLQMHQCWARQTKTPAAIVFFDMKAAFYSVLRQALTSCSDRTNAFHFAMHRLGLRDDEVSDMLQSVANESAVEGVSSHVEKLVHDTMTGTYFTVEGIDAPVATHKGTRPGDPIGDLLFNLTMSRILAEMKDLVIEEQVAEWFGTPQQCVDFTDPGPLPASGFADVSFVDDCAVAIHAPDLVQLQATARSVVTAMHVAARRRGLHLNFEAGKTEMLWHVQGKGSKQLKQQLMHDHQTLQWHTVGVDFALRVVQSYRHLGTWLQSGGCLMREIQSRAHGAKSAWGSLARQFFAKKYVSMPTKIKVFRSLALSRHMFNVHTWSAIKPAELDRWANSIRQPLCSLAKLATKGFPPRLFDVSTLGGLVGLETPQDRLHAARLRYFARLIKQCPQAMWTLIWNTLQVEGAWGALLLDSFGWFCKFYGTSWTLTPQCPIDQWILAVQTDGAWKGRVKSALRKSCQYRQAQAEHAVWQKSFDSSFFADTGAAPPGASQDAARWQCDQCDKWFSSKKGLATHSQRVHGYRRLVRFFATGDTCPACCKLHHCRMRLCQHLTHSTACMTILQACFPPLSDEQVEMFDRLDDAVTEDLKRQGWWRTKALLPACLVPGPLLPAAGTNDANDMHARGVSRAHNQIGSAFTHLQGHMIGPLTDESQPQQPQEHPAEGYIFQSEQGFLDGNGLFLRDGLPTLHTRMNIRTRVFVHFFSGFRRHHDLHDIVSHWVYPDGLQVFALSVDMCLQKVAGDLTSDASAKFWKEQVLSGRVFGAGGGPPCETFTSARLQGEGPRALRTATEPTGLPDLSAREWRQVLVGTRLVQFILDILYVLAKTGGCGFCEHPQYPVWCAARAPCSVWSWPATKQLRQLSCTSVVSFDQCVMQASILKPTTILLVRLWDFRHDALARGRCGRCPHGRRAHTRLVGKDTNGQFKTARGKIYPPQLNWSLGQAIARYVERTFSQPEFGSVDMVLPDIFERFVNHDFVNHSEVQPDFHG